MFIDFEGPANMFQMPVISAKCTKVPTCRYTNNMTRLRSYYLCCVSMCYFPLKPFVFIAFTGFLLKRKLKNAAKTEVAIQVYGALWGLLAGSGIHHSEQPLVSHLTTIRWHIRRGMSFRSWLVTRLLRYKMSKGGRHEGKSLKLVLYLSFSQGFLL